MVDSFTQARTKLGWDRNVGEGSKLDLNSNMGSFFQPVKGESMEFWKRKHGKDLNFIRPETCSSN